MLSRRLTKVLSKEQLNTYREEGFLQLSGLIPAAVVKQAQQAVLASLKSSPLVERLEFVKDRKVLACFGSRVCSAAAELSDSRRALAPPKVVYAITVSSTSPPWHWPSPHIDHANEEDRFKTFPPPFRLGCLIYLNDIASHAGGTVVWPKSHHQIEALAASDPKKYEYLSVLNRDISNMPLQSPVEVTAKAGEILFYDRLCAHSGSMNVGPDPRFALNHKW